jgi:quinol monooxygenase YgiN
MSDQSVVLVDLLKAHAGKQEELLELLKLNTDSVIRTLPGWRTTRLIASGDGRGVAIYSEWETPAAIEAMRADARMKACFQKIAVLASLESLVGSRRSGEART